MLRGKLVSWKDDRGFGFIRPDGAEEDVFVHIKQFVDPSQRPRISERLSFRIETDNRGRRRAVDVRPLSAQPQRHRPGSRTARQATGAWLPWAGVGFVLLLFAASGLDRIQGWLPGWYVALSAVTFVLYWADKSAARAGRWRVPEVNLLGLSLAGGWPGALLAQYRLRHKTRKKGFQLLFWLTVIANLVVLFLLVGNGLSWASFQRAF